MSIFKEGIDYVSCPHCNESISLAAWNHKYKCRQLGHIRIVCRGCGVPFKLVLVDTYVVEK